MNVLFFTVNSQNYFVDTQRIKYIRNNSEVRVTTIPSNSDTSSLGYNMYHNRVFVVKDAGIMLQQHKIPEPKTVIYFDNLIALKVSAVENVEEIDMNELQSPPIQSQYVNSVLIHEGEIHLEIDADKLRNFKLP